MPSPSRSFVHHSDVSQVIPFEVTGGHPEGVDSGRGAALSAILPLTLAEQDDDAVALGHEEVHMVVVVQVGMLWFAGPPADEIVLNQREETVVCSAQHRHVVAPVGGDHVGIGIAIDVAHAHPLRGVAHRIGGDAAKGAIPVAQERKVTVSSEALTLKRSSLSSPSASPKVTPRGELPVA